jgi:hypothetical protein
MNTRRLSIPVFALLISAAAVAAADVWGVKTHDPVSQPPSTLFRISEDGNSLTIVSAVLLEGGNIEVDGLALGSDQTLYGFQIAASGSRLITIDPSTAAATARGPYLAGRQIRGAALTSDGHLLCLDAANGRLLEIATANGEPTGPEIELLLDGSPFPVSNMVDLVEVAPGQLALMRFNEFYSLDAGTGALVLLHRDDAAASDGAGVGGAGLAWLPAASGGGRFAVYDVQFDDDIFAYDPANAYQRSYLHPNIITEYNAGRGDLASAPTGAVGVGDPAPHPGAARLEVRPNPFNPRTTITFTLTDAAGASLTIHDLAGREVRRLARGDFDAGAHAFDWDGRDRDGRTVPAGVYLCRVIADGRAVWKRIALVR